MEQQNKAQSENVNPVDMLQQNKKTVIGGVIGVIVVIIAVVGLIFFFINNSKSNTEKANKAVYSVDLKAAQAFSAEADSTIILDYINASTVGKKAGNRAKLEVAIRYYAQGNYTEAIKYLEDADIESSIIGAGQYTLLGDCYVNTDNLDKALSCYDKAISKADKNPLIVPFVLVKEANIYRAQGNFSKEAATYKKIIADYPHYTRQHPDLRKFATRAEVEAGK